MVVLTPTMRKVAPPILYESVRKRGGLPAGKSSAASLDPPSIVATVVYAGKATGSAAERDRLSPEKSSSVGWFGNSPAPTATHHLDRVAVRWKTYFTSH